MLQSLVSSSFQGEKYDSLANSPTDSSSPSGSESSAENVSSGIGFSFKKALNLISFGFQSESYTNEEVGKAVASNSELNSTELINARKNMHVYFRNQLQFVVQLTDICERLRYY
jgi:hypothetical protein